jgi:hypothetical protein
MPAPAWSTFTRWWTRWKPSTVSFTRQKSAGFHIEPVKIAVEHQRLSAALGLVGRKERIQRERVAVQPARDPQRVHVE